MVRTLRFASWGSMLSSRMGLRFMRIATRRCRWPFVFQAWPMRIRAVATGWPKQGSPCPPVPTYEILKAFRLFDDDETGKITLKNLKRVANELGERMTDEELQEMIDEADRGGDGEVNEEEFLRIMKKTNLF
ncbi:unnamed protein product [Prorocentrum cordatum]|uniref:EF-hand domain-containing protein n=1 Tax=Prorocentrum cordatum TaxID=2364126 RepID=A0ABN9T0H0_9DINO|nr:unnamed protein product [Polarella glacialis]